MVGEPKANGSVRKCRGWWYHKAAVPERRTLDPRNCEETELLCAALAIVTGIYKSGGTGSGMRVRHNRGLDACIPHAAPGKVLRLHLCAQP